MMKEDSFFKNLSICRLLLLSSSSSWDFCWMQSKHIENDSGGIFIFYLLLSFFTFTFFYHFLTPSTFNYLFLVYSCFTFTFLQHAFNLSHSDHAVFFSIKSLPSTGAPRCFFPHYCLTLLPPLSYLKPIVWSSFKLPFDLLPSPQLALGAKANKSSVQRLYDLSLKHF